MSDQLPMKPSELKSFLKFEGSYNYSLKRFIDIGHFRAALLLQDNVLKEDVLGKIVGDYNEGEFIQWPHLHHENVILLLDMVPLSYQKTIFIFTFHEKTLGAVVRDASFKFHPKCFDRKRSYVKDVLSGLEYLHQKSVSLMNLNDENVLICSQTDKAVISDLSCSVSTKTTTKANYPVMLANLFPSEVDDGGEFECLPFDLWNCGVMFLQMFTMHVLPWCQDRETDYLEGLTTELLRQTNPGSNLQDNTANNLKNFLALFLQKDPKLRVSAKAALTSVFLLSSGKRIDEEARDFWKACETEKQMSDGKFREVKIQHGTEDIYCKRKDTNHSIAKEMSHFTDIKLKKSKSNSELYAIARNSNSEFNSFYKVASKNRSNGISPPRNSLLKRTSYSEEYLRDIFSWIYDNIPAIDGSNVAKKAEEKEVKPEVEIKDECLTTVSKATEEIARNLNPEDSSKFYSKEKYSGISNSTFDLPCRCVFCTGIFDQENSLKLIPSRPLPDITTMGSVHSSEQMGTAFFSQTQGGFLHNNWKAERRYATDRSCPNLVKDNSTKQSNEKDLQNSWDVEHKKHSDKLEFQNVTPVNLTWSTWIENHRKDSEMPTRKVYPDNSFTSGENQLMFQRCTGFRNGLKFRTPFPYPSPTIITRTQLPPYQDEDKTSREGQVKSDRRITHVTDSATSDGSCVKKGKKFTKKKESDGNPSGTDSRVVMEARSEENKVVDISMELPLCSKSDEKRKSNKAAFRDKPKQKWIRVLCPGSVFEEKTVAEDIGNEK
ncbi:hypothetical protein AVEN_93037-1 [Araneus ventricosus]|uniref:Protein kinase domain-containing protein n=1 Tax=Araneus ventricosus TaxID=182803 RepID=A0A4Y2NBT3_ARAVE|nr:hypothetical protein AVEN_93037-1 [Araneus ventricosus]